MLRSIDNQESKKLAEAHPMIVKALKKRRRSIKAEKNCSRQATKQFMQYNNTLPLTASVLRENKKFRSKSFFPRIKALRFVHDDESTLSV